MLRENLTNWFGSFLGPVGYEIRDLRITAGDDLAFSQSFNRISGSRMNGEETDVWVRSTMVPSIVLRGSPLSEGLRVSDARNGGSISKGTGRCSCMTKLVQSRPSSGPAPYLKTTRELRPCDS